MLTCQYCGASLPNTSAVCECRKKRSLDPSGLHSSLAPVLPIPGMTLRDWFAGQALAGMLADPEVDARTGLIAFAAYQIADAMIAERERGK